MDVGGINRIIAASPIHGLLQISRSRPAAEAPALRQRDSISQSTGEDGGVIANISTRGAQLAEELARATQGTPLEKSEKSSDRAELSKSTVRRCLSITHITLKVTKWIPA